MAHLLVVDDDAEVREVLALGLQRSGHRVRAVGDPREVLPLVATEHVDLVVLDWAMPHLTGGQVCAQLRELPHMAGVPVIVATAYDDLVTRQQALAAGATQYLAKPFALSQLDALVTASLRHAADVDVAPDPERAERPLLRVLSRPRASCPAQTCHERHCPDRVPGCDRPLYQR